MMAIKRLPLLFLTCLSSLYAEISPLFKDLKDMEQKIVISTKRILLEDFPGAHNPSMIETDEGYLMTFRYCPDPYYQPWLSYIGIVLLDESFQPISQPELLNTRFKNSKTPSQSEDARVFSYRGRLFLIYNDNIEIVYPSYGDRRDMFMTELLQEDGHYFLSAPLKLVHEEKYPSQLWQKNWVPFEWNKTLFISYYLNPHEVLYANLFNGVCHRHYETSAKIDWSYGTLRGSTPPLKIDGEFLAFFHSWVYAKSHYSNEEEAYHYFMGAYTFSPEPPFNVTKMTALPIFVEEFYVPSTYYKKVVFPGGFVESGPFIYLAYGKDDWEIWIATLDKQALKKALKPVSR